MTSPTLYPWRATVQDADGSTWTFTVDAEDPLAAVENASHGLSTCDVLMVEACGNGFADAGAADCPLCQLEQPARCSWHQTPGSPADREYERSHP